MFQYQVAVWECKCNVWHEAFGVQDVSCPPKLRITPWQLEGLPETPNFVQYFRLVENYNVRALTYPDDGLQAFTGVTTALTHVFPGGFAWGLPCYDFLCAMLWLPKEPLRRRVPRKSGAFLPSWSWVGWEGRIDADAWTEEPSTQPEDTWQSIPAYQDCVAFVSNDFRSSEPGLVPMLLPLVDALCATFKLGGLYQNVPQDGSVVIRDYHNKFCGIMFRAFGSEVQRGAPSPICEVVALSKSGGRLAPGKYVASYGSDIDSTYVGPYYNVLWITKESGVVHRLGVGRIVEEAWTRAAIRKRTVVLG